MKQEYQEVALSVASLVEKLDLPEENIATLLCYLEDYSPPLVNVTNHVYCQVTLAPHWPICQADSCSHSLAYDVQARVQCYGGPRQLRQIASKCPPLAAAIAILRQGGADLSSASSVEFPVVEVSAR